MTLKEYHEKQERVTGAAIPLICGALDGVDVLYDDIVPGIEDDAEFAETGYGDLTLTVQLLNVDYDEAVEAAAVVHDALAGADFSTEAPGVSFTTCEADETGGDITLYIDFSIG